MQPYYLRLWRMSSQKVVFARDSFCSVSPSSLLRLSFVSPSSLYPLSILPLHRHPHRRHRRRVILNCVKTLAPCMSHSSQFQLFATPSTPFSSAPPLPPPRSSCENAMTRALPCNVSLWGLPSMHFPIHPYFWPRFFFVATLFCV